MPDDRTDAPPPPPAPAPALTLQAIGVIRTPFATPAGTPIQPCYAADAEGELLLDPALAPALRDLAGFERVWLIYHLDRAGPFTPEVVPYRDTQPHGLFATRSPTRPNPIGLSVVRLLGVDGHRVRVAGVDMLDGTPLLDLKPYVPSFDAYPESRSGWFDATAEDRRVADDRFHRGPFAAGPK